MKPQWFLLLAFLLATQSGRSTAAVRFLVPESAFVLRGGSSTGGKSLLGYRVAALKQGSDHYLLVSDPRGSASGTSIPSGVVYKLKLTADAFNTTQNLRSVSSEISFEFASQERDGHVNRSVAQFGASISTLPTGQFAVCAPGYNFANSFNHTVTPGLCAYWKSINSEPSWFQKIFKYEPSNAKETMFGNCMGGFDAELYDPADPKLAVSGPFCMLRRLALVSLATNRTSREEHQVGEENDYSGFSLTIEREKQKPDLYVTLPHSATKGITVMMRTRSPTVKLQRIVMRNDNPYYSQLKRAFNYIGYSSTTVKFMKPRAGQNDTAVILGAPFESNSLTPNFGCVYVVPIEADKTDDRSQSLALKASPVQYCGSDPGGRLGTSVVSIGDINHDGSEDFAVGCPGCGANRTGAVYLFLGLTSYQAASKLEPLEILKATNLFPGVSGLGWSMALAGDLDNNGANDIVVSAIGSSHVILLPARILLRMSIEFKYSGNPLTDINFNQLRDRQSMEVDMTISFKSGAGSDSRIYTFDLEVMLQEFVKTKSLKRFDVEVVNPLISNSNDWQQLTRSIDPGATDSINFALRFRMTFRSNSTRHLPANVLLRDLTLLVQWRMLNRQVRGASSHLFPAVLYENKIFPNYDNELTAKIFGFISGVCDSPAFCETEGNLKLELLNASTSKLTLDSFQTTTKILTHTIALSVRKTTPYTYYGGSAIQLDMSEGMSVTGNVEIQQSNVRNNVAYWSEHNELLITEPYPLQEDILTKNDKGQLNVSVPLRFDGMHSSYKASFKLVNILATEGYEAYVTKEMDEMDNVQLIEIEFNTSLLLKLLPQNKNTTVVDQRENTDEAYLKSLKQRVSGSAIGPPLQHTYELFAASNPMLPVHDLSLTVRVPFVTLDNRLLLYFPRKSIGSSVQASASQLQPGLPFLSNDLEGFVDNSDYECQPVEKELSELLFKPDLVLLEMKHRTNASAVNRRRREAGRLADSSELLEKINTSSNSLATSNAKVLPTNKEVEAIPVFDCEQPHQAPFQFKCITFNCRVRTMIDRNGSIGTTPDKVYLHVHAKVWPPTFFDARLKTFSIRSQVELRWPRSMAFMNVDKTDNSSIMETFHFVNAKFPIDEEIPWGYVILAIFLGIWLLLLCILLLWYCNFFNRKKFDYNSVPQNDPANLVEQDTFYQ